MHFKDRYSYWHKIIPLLLSGEADEVQEVQTVAREAFHEVRAQALSAVWGWCLGLYCHCERTFAART